MTVHTIRVVEDRSVDVELSPDVAAELLAAPDDLFDARPLGVPGGVRVTAGGRVGFWESASLRVQVDPKIDCVNILAMTDPEAPIVADGGGDFESVLAGFAARLGRLMVRHAAKELRRGYGELREESGFLTGKLDVAAHARDPRPSMDHFHVERDAFTLDIPVNQFPKAVAEWLRPRFPTDLDHALRAYANVNASGFDPASMVDMPANLNPAEADIFGCAQMLWGGCGFASPIHGRATLEILDLHRVFEQYIARELATRLPEFGIVTQRPISLAIEVADRHFRLTGAPDIMVSAGGRASLVADTKWKVLDGRPAPADVHQVIAYMHATDSLLGMLIYPGVENTRKDLGVLGGGTLIVQHIQVTGTIGECQAAMSAFADALRNCLRPLEEQTPERRDRQGE